MYTNYPTRAQVLESMPWYRVRDLLPVINALRAINFGLTEQRQQALQRLANLPHDSPYAVDSRYADGAFVCEGLGDWASKFQQVRSALCFRDRSKDQHIREHAESLYGNYNDSSQAYYKALNAIYDQIVRLDGVYTRDSFERDFGLVWA